MRVVRTALVVSLLAGVVGIQAPATADPTSAETRAAATTITYCDDDRATYKVTKGSARKVKVTIVALGCVEHTTEPDGTVTCSRVTSLDAWRLGSKVSILDKRVIGRGRFSKGPLYTQQWDGCGFGAQAHFERDQEFGRQYRYPATGDDLQAFPVVAVKVRGFQGPVHPESVLTLVKRGSWKFKKPGGIVSASP